MREYVDPETLSTTINLHVIQLGRQDCDILHIPPLWVFYIFVYVFSYHTSELINGRITISSRQVICLEADFSELLKERDRLLKVVDKYEAAKTAVARKDAVIKVML